MLLKNYLVEYIGGSGMTAISAEVEAPEADQARTQMLDYLTRKGTIAHRHRGKIRKAKSLGEPRLRVKMVDKGTSGARIELPWLWQKEITTDLVMPRQLPQVHAKPIEPRIVEEPTPERVDVERVMYEREFEPPSASQTFDIPPLPTEDTLGEDQDMDYGDPLAKESFGQSPIMRISRMGGGK